jgi:hypothetical protein
VQEIIRSASEVSFIYLGLDSATRRTELRFEPPPTQLTASAATYQLRLEADQSLHVFFFGRMSRIAAPQARHFLQGVDGGQPRSQIAVAARGVGGDLE